MLRIEFLCGGLYFSKNSYKELGTEPTNFITSNKHGKELQRQRFIRGSSEIIKEIARKKSVTGLDLGGNQSRKEGYSSCLMER